MFWFIEFDLIRIISLPEFDEKKYGTLLWNIFDKNYK